MNVLGGEGSSLRALWQTSSIYTPAESGSFGCRGSVLGFGIKVLCFRISPCQDHGLCPSFSCNRMKGHIQNLDIEVSRGEEVAL